MTDPAPRWDLTDEQVESILRFSYCNKPDVRRGECLTPVTWPWLGGRSGEPHETGDAA